MAGKTSRFASELVGVLRCLLCGLETRAQSPEAVGKWKERPASQSCPLPPMNVPWDAHLTHHSDTINYFNLKNVCKGLTPSSDISEVQV